MPTCDEPGRDWSKKIGYEMGTTENTQIIPQKSHFVSVYSISIFVDYATLVWAQKPLVFVKQRTDLRAVCLSIQLVAAFCAPNIFKRIVVSTMDARYSS